MSTWEDGVRDAIQIVKDRKRTLLALHDGVSICISPAAIGALEDATIHLEAMLSRKQYASRDTVFDNGSKKSDHDDFSDSRYVEAYDRGALDAQEYERKRWEARLERLREWRMEESGAIETAEQAIEVLDEAIAIMEGRSL